jgi:pimeloyl-ACP methyl ester carboxylesterase
MTETWHNYFLNPRHAPDPDPKWLNGCSAEVMLRTDRAVTRQSPDILDGLRNYTAPAMVLYGAYDIFGDVTQIVRSRFAHATQITLGGSGHLHWIQNPTGYAEALDDFYGKALSSRAE